MTLLPETRAEVLPYSDRGQDSSPLHRAPGTPPLPYLPGWKQQVKGLWSVPNRKAPLICPNLSHFYVAQISHFSENHI